MKSENDIQLILDSFPTNRKDLESLPQEVFDAVIYIIKNPKGVLSQENQIIVKEYTKYLLQNKPIDSKLLN